MADVTLTDGTEITIDLHAITLEQFRGLYDKAESEKESDATIARACNIDPDAFVKLSYYDYKLIIKHFFKKSREPLADPNSPSAPS